MEKAAYLLYLFVLVFTPLAIGAIDPWALFIMEGCSFLALICYLSAILRNDRAWIEPPALFPLLIFLTWMAFQLIPLPRSLVAFISPAIIPLYEPDLTTGQPASIPLSVYPLYTIQDLFRFSAYAAYYFLTVQFLQDPKRLRQTLTLALTLAAGIAFYGIIQHYTGDDRIYWFRTFTHKPVFGTFAYKNHFAGYIELLLPLALALFLFYHSRRPVAVSPVQAFLDLWNRGTDNQHLFFLLVSCTMVLALLLSNSRAGVFCCFLFVLLLFLLGRKHFSLSGLLPTALGLILLVAVTGVGRDGLSTVYHGFRTAVFKDGVSLNGRVEFWKNAVHIVSDFSLTGTGAGTFQAIYPRYERHPNGARPLYAHNDYLETQTTGGLIASFSAAAFFFLFFRSTLARYRRCKNDYSVHLYLGSLAGLAALLLHCLIELQFRGSAAVGLYFFFILGVNAAGIPLEQHRGSPPPIHLARFSGLRGWGALGLLSLFFSCCLIFQIGELRALALFPEISTAENRMGKAGYENTKDLLALESFAAYKGLDAEKKKDVCNRASSALHLSPLNPRYHFIRSLCADSEDTLERALADCRIALRLSPLQTVYTQRYRTLLENKESRINATP